MKNAVRFDGDLYDCGSKLGFLMANVAYGLTRDGLGDEFREELKSYIDREGLTD